MDWDSIGQHAATALVSGVTSLLAASARFKNGFQKADSRVKALGQGWKLEVDGIKADFETKLATLKQEFESYKELRDGIEAARKEERVSHADPFERVESSLSQLRTDIEKLKERGGRYVRNDTFAAFARSQEEQWRQINRTLGQLEGALKE